jgi:hypothetical protein
MCEIVKLVEEWDSQFFERDRLKLHGRHVHKYVNCVLAGLFPNTTDNLVKNEASPGKLVPCNTAPTVAGTDFSKHNILLLLATKSVPTGRTALIILRDFHTSWNKPPASPVANGRGGTGRILSPDACTPISNKDGAKANEEDVGCRCVHVRESSSPGPDWLGDKT